MYGNPHWVLVSAGLVGVATAIVHGLLTNRLMVRPLGQMLAGRKTVSSTVRRILAPLLHYTTFSWLIGGIALIVVAFGEQPGSRLAVSLVVGASYLYAALANVWATRARHPGWMLMAVAVAMIAFDILRNPAALIAYPF